MRELSIVITFGFAITLLVGGVFLVLDATRRIFRQRGMPGRGQVIRPV